jgi:hypothetical protein
MFQAIAWKLFFMMFANEEEWEKLWGRKQKIAKPLAHIGLGPDYHWVKTDALWY